ncbi:hypothetical protein HMPREF9212_1105 [Lactobacillus iners LactinV 03V1-b]|nr:hypothetical protein HMPREF9212_1105 [Lactobacillus iners LactinV 03V1-b]
MLSLRKKYKILIDYSDFNIHDAKRYFNGMTELEFTGKELYESVITCGMPYVLPTEKILISRIEEIMYKFYLLNTALEVDSHRYLIFSKKMHYLDSTECAYLNYYIGMFITKLVSSKIFGFDYLVHLNIVKRYMSVKFNSPKRPDLIAFNKYVNIYSIFEAKGRTRLDNRTLIKAKKQVQAIKYVNGAKPSNGIVSAVVHDNKSMVKCYLRDPEPKGSETLNIPKSLLIWLYYEPIYLLFKEEKNIEKCANCMNVPIRINYNETLTISMNTKLYQLLREYEESNIRNCYKHIDENFDEKFLEDFSKISEPLKME